VGVLRISFSLVCVLLALLTARSAHAALGADVERLKLAWAQQGKLLELSPRLLERGGVRRLFLPRDATDPNTDDCTTIAVLGAPSTNFVLRFLPTDDEEASRDWPEPSVAGAAQLTRCGARKGLLGRIAVEMRSPRGVLEFIVARSTEPPPVAVENPTAPRPRSAGAAS